MERRGKRGVRHPHRLKAYPENKRSCELAVEVLEGGKYEGPQEVDKVEEQTGFVRP